MKDCITTYTKSQVNVLNPDPETLYIEDVAHALSMMTRAGGHFPTFFSVAQHCLQCYEEAKARSYSPEVCLICLLHDASEAYLADVTRPVKKNMTMYIQIEEQLQNMLYEKFLGRLPDKRELDLMQNIDDAALYYEFVYFMDEKLFAEEPVMITSPDYTSREMTSVENAYLKAFSQCVKAIENANL